MLLITFKAGQLQYALEAHKIIEIVPLAILRAYVGAPAYIAGLFNFRGAPVPVVDLGRLTGGTPCAAHLSTRIILVPYTAQDGRQRAIGLMAESVTETMDKQASDFTASGLATPETPYLGPVAMSASGVIQQVVIEHLLPKELEGMLFAVPEKEVPK